MSIIGTTLDIADVATGIGFNYTQIEYEDKIAGFESLINRLKIHQDDLMDLRNQIPGFWDDTEAHETYKALELTIIKVRQAMERAERLTNDCKEIVSDLKKGKEEIQGFIQDANGILNGLEIMDDDF